MDSGKSFSFYEELVDWGGEYFPQDPPKYVANNKLIFKKTPIPSYMVNFLPKEEQYFNWNYLSFYGEDLRAWEYSINEKTIEIVKNDLKTFLLALTTELEKWVVIFSINCDQIDDILQLNSIELINQIESNLNWNKEPRGFISWSNG